MAGRNGCLQSYAFGSSNAQVVIGLRNFVSLDGMTLFSSCDKGNMWSGLELDTYMNTMDSWEYDLVKIFPVCIKDDIVFVVERGSMR